LCPKVLIVYDSNTGTTEKLAQAVAKGIRQIEGVDVELKRTEEVSSDEAIKADGYAIGSPSHFSIMSGKILTLLTKLYPMRHKMSSKPMAVFTTGTGGQVLALENIHRIIGVYNPNFIMPGLAVETVPARASPWEIDEAQAMELGRRLAEAVIKQQQESET